MGGWGGQIFNIHIYLHGINEHCLVKFDVDAAEHRLPKVWSIDLYLFPPGHPSDKRTTVSLSPSTRAAQTTAQRGGAP